MRPFLLLLAIPLLITACSTVPITGRRALSIVPDSEVATLAVDSYRQLLSQSKLSSNTQDVEMIRRVGQRIAAVSGHPEYKWEYNLIDEPKTQNAFCMPGGKVAFYTGILPVTQNETGVAVVMGHEVAHAIAKHGSERMSQQMLMTVGEMTLAEAMSKKPQQVQAMAATAFGLGSSIGYLLPFSRLQESEADRIGLIFMAKAGYDPRESVGFWQRMGQSGGGASPEFLSTHPSHSTRIQDLQKWMPEAIAEYEKSPYKK